jgi:hypothetical protein
MEPDRGGKFLQTKFARAFSKKQASYLTLHYCREKLILFLNS